MVACRVDNTQFFRVYINVYNYLFTYLNKNIFGNFVRNKKEIKENNKRNNNKLKRKNGVSIIVPRNLPVSPRSNDSLKLWF